MLPNQSELSLKTKQSSSFEDVHELDPLKNHFGSVVFEFPTLPLFPLTPNHALQNHWDVSNVPRPHKLPVQKEEDETPAELKLLTSSVSPSTNLFQNLI